jgi:hypothetical protein
MKLEDAMKGLDAGDEAAMHSIVIASAMNEVLKSEGIETIGSVLALLLCRWLSRIPPELREKALDGVLAATAKLVEINDAG